MSSKTAEAASQTGFDPNVINFAGIEVSAPHLSALMTSAYYLDRDAYPFLSPGARDWLRPTINYGDGYIERNSKRDRLEAAMPRLAPIAGQLLLGLESGQAPQFTPAQAASAKQGVASYMQPGAAMDTLRATSDQDAASILNFMGLTGLPFATRLEVFGSQVRRKVGPQLETARPYVKILTSGEQPGARQEFQHEVRGLLSLIQHTARQRAASRERDSIASEGPKSKAKLERRLQEDPDRYMNREDTAAGIAEAIQAVLANENTAPMLHGLAQNILARTGQTKGKDIKMNTKALEIGSDIIVKALLAALPENEQQEFRGLYSAATSISAISFWAKRAVGASVWVPGAIKRKIITDLGVSPKMADILAKRGRKIYHSLDERLPRTFQALSGVLPTTDKRIVVDRYNRLQRALGLSTAVGRATVPRTVLATR